MEIIYKNTADLKLFQKNPNKHPETQLKMLSKSMREFGFTNPILISQENMVIAGHARLLVAQEIGLENVPTIFIDLPYEKAVAYILADNQLARLAEEDTAMLGELLLEISELPDFDIEATGFTLEDLASFTVPGFEPAAEEDVPRLDKKDFVICPHCGKSFDSAEATKIEGGPNDGT